MPHRRTHKIGMLIDERLAMKILAAALACVVLGSAAFAQQLDPKVLRQRTYAPRLVDRPRPKPPCSEYGAGFVFIESLGTCVRASGAIQLGVGFSR